MDVSHPRCWGLDKKMVMACAITPGLRGAPQREIPGVSRRVGEAILAEVGPRVFIPWPTYIEDFEQPPETWDFSARQFLVQRKNRVTYMLFEGHIARTRPTALTIIVNATQRIEREPLLVEIDAAGRMGTSRRTLYLVPEMPNLPDERRGELDA